MLVTAKHFFIYQYTASKLTGGRLDCSASKKPSCLIHTVEPWLPNNLHYSLSVATTVQPLQGLTLKLCSELSLSYSAAPTLPVIAHSQPASLSPKDTKRNNSFTCYPILLLVVVLLLLFHSSSLYNL